MPAVWAEFYEGSQGLPQVEGTSMKGAEVIGDGKGVKGAVLRGKGGGHVVDESMPNALEYLASWSRVWRWVGS